ncbi:MULTISPECIES: hypothetical protein [unclassified Pseudomonas]|nr:hypothetical protein [Pseudomonas sp. B21-048]UVK96715.1 hypothetical protein LOY56_15050 [Pseudomonas sp. B21-048]
MTQRILFALIHRDRKGPAVHLDANDLVSAKGGDTQVDGLDLGGFDS